MLEKIIADVYKYGNSETFKYLFLSFYKRLSNFAKRKYRKSHKLINNNGLEIACERIPERKHYSLSGQDIFVSSLFSNLSKTNYYVEIGAGWPIKINNTYLLEHNFNWKGISIDFDQEMSNTFNKKRINKCLFADATKINYLNLFASEDLPFDLDYLSLDIDPANQTLLVLSLIPFDTYKFKVITFEHDTYRNGSLIKIVSRLLLTKYGYLCVYKDVKAAGFGKYEDWWIHPKYISIQEGIDAAEKARNLKN